MITKSVVSLDAKITIVLNEREARALEAIFSYGQNDFIDFFYKNLGSYYLKPYEDGLRTLMTSVRQGLPTELRKIDDARKALQSKES